MNIILVLLLILIGFCLYFLYRNNEVYKFMTSLNYLLHNGIFAYLEKLEDEQFFKEIDKLLEKRALILYKHSYEKILYSFKKLKLENWFNSEEIAFLKQCKVWLETTKPQK